jgi:hypothetical protein
MFEQRKCDRKNVEVVVKYLPEDDYSSLYTGAFSKNISASGFCLSLFKKFPVNTRLKSRFIFPNGDGYIEADGRVVWVSEVIKDRIYDIGLHFTDINEDNLTKVHRLLGIE